MTLSPLCGSVAGVIRPEVWLANGCSLRTGTSPTVRLSIAESRRANAVVAGHIQSDGKAYRDATERYLADLYTLANSGTFAFGGLPAAQISLELPLIHLSGKEVISLGRELGAPLDSTWSCLMDGMSPCGDCVSCRDRANAIQY